jgi:tight adherence protein B
MGGLIGLCLGLGLLLVWRALTVPRRAGRGRLRRLDGRLGELLAQAGYPSVRPRQLLVLCAACAAVGFVTAAGISRAPVIGIAFAAFAGYAPVALVKARRRRRSVELRELWPEVVDNLGSAVRAGLSLPEAVSQLAVRGPELLRPAFARFADDYRATGRFGECLDRLKADLADPVADRIAESLRVACDVGGSDLGRLLRTLSAFLRDDARTRAEIEARQSWTVNAARLGVAAPWVVLGLLSLRPQTVAAYDSATGAAILAVGGAVSLLAYRLMLRLARLPVEQRVLR